MSSIHPTTDLEYDSQIIKIDSLLAPLMLLLWKKGIETLQSCQEARQRTALIEFAATADLELFLRVAQKHYHFELETWDEGEDGELALRIRLLVYFPIEDIPELVAKFTTDERE